MANNSKINSGNVLKGAAAVTAVAGVVAAGVLLSDKKNRKKAGKMAKKGMDFIQEVAGDAQEKYHAVAQSVPIKEISSKKQSTKGRSKKS